MNVVTSNRAGQLSWDLLEIKYPGDVVLSPPPKALSAQNHTPNYSSTSANFNLILRMFKDHLSYIHEYILLDDCYKFQYQVFLYH